MKLKNLTMAVLALASLSFTACTVSDNAAEPQPAKLSVVSAQPTDFEDGIWVKPISWLTNWNIEFAVTFDDEVVIKNATPEISLVSVYNGADIESKQNVEATHWSVTPGDDAKTVIVKLVNDEGSVIGVKFGDEGYSITIPAGVVSNVAGTVSNEEITGTFYTSAVAKEREGLPTALTLVSALPSDVDDNNIWVKPISWLSTWNVEFVLTFDEDVVVAKENPEGITLLNVYSKKGIEEKTFETTKWTVKAAEAPNAVIVRLENEDGSLIAAKLEDEAYKLTVPAGVITNVAGTVPSGEITATFYSSQVAVENNGRPTSIKAVSVLPESYDAENLLWTKENPFASTWNLKFVVTFDTQVTVNADFNGEGIDLVTAPGGESIIKVKNLTEFGEVKWVVEAIEDQKNAVLVRLIDAEFGGSKAAKLEDEAYKLIIPAGIVVSSTDNIPSAAATATFYSSEAAKAIK